jgi:16S rRNA (cytidine1402-2'-O)-methyltransferase
MKARDTNQRCLSQAVIALGANLGDASATLRAAAEKVGQLPGVTVVASSQIYRTEPAYLEEQFEFRNAVMLVDTNLKPLSLLRELQGIERQFGRERTVKNGPRSLDLDIVDFAGFVSDTAELKLPHPLALERDFVVTPLLEIAPGYQLADGSSVTTMAVSYGKVTGTDGPLLERCRLKQIAFKSRSHSSLHIARFSDYLQSIDASQDEGATERQASADKPGLLSICATPIGNLGDITLRVIEALGSADIIYAEDTRVSRKLLTHLDIHTRLERCDENTVQQRLPRIIDELRLGRRVAYVSDAGTPGVSDPGMQLVAATRAAGLAVEVLPGASALLTAWVAAGFTAPGLYFGGFLPRKEGQIKATLEQLAALDAVSVFYESPHRTARSLAIIAQVFPEREVVLARELTKLHEEVLRGPAPDIAAQIDQRSQAQPMRGEVALVIGPPVSAASQPRIHRDKYASKAKG